MMKLFRCILLVGVMLFSFNSADLKAQASPNCKSSVSSTNGANSLCSGDNLLLWYGDTSSGKKVYQWFTGSHPNLAAIVGATKPQLLISSGNTYYIRVVDTSSATTKVDTGYCFRTITLNTTPNSNFTYTPNTGVICGTTSFNFNGVSQSGCIYDWTFGDINFNQSNIVNPTHTYTPTSSGAATNYNVTLIVKNANSTCYDTTKKIITIGAGPDAKLDENNTIIYEGKYTFTDCTGGSNFTFTFSNNSSTPSSQISKYKLDWGDGQIDSLSSFTTTTHLYNIGLYTLRYSIMGANGCTNTKDYYVFVGTNPAVGFGSPGNTDICIGTSLTFPITSVGSNPPGTTYIIHYTDGSNDTSFTTYPPPAQISHIFNNTSCGTTNDLGQSNAFSAKITAVNPCSSTPNVVGSIKVSLKPNVKFSSNLPVDTTCVNSTITFTNNSNIGVIPYSSTNCNSGNIVWDIQPSIGWSIATGTLGTGANVNPNAWTSGSNNISIIFTTPGTYAIKLKGSGFNTKCGYDSLTKTICVQSPSLPSFICDTTNGCNPLLVNFTNTSPANPSCGNPIVNWEITSSIFVCTDSLQEYRYVYSTTASSNNPVITFNNQATYAVKLTLANSCGVIKSAAQDIIVKRKPQVIVTSPTIVCLNVPFTANATVDNCAGINPSFLWNFQNGNPATSTSKPATNIKITTVGSNLISLSATNECGTTTSTKSVIVNPTPILDTIFNFNLCKGTLQNAINFTSSIAGTTYSWANTNPSINLPATGTGNIAAFTPSNSTSNPITATITVTPKYNNCTGLPRSFTITVNPLPTITTVNSITKCSGEAITPNAFTGTSGVSFDWTNNNTSIGLAASGSGNIPSFVATNPGATPITATINVTPSNNGCSGSSTGFTITINPIPIITDSSFVNPTGCSSNDGSISLKGLTNGVTYTINYKKAGVSQTAITQTASGGMATINNLVAATYSEITVTANGCNSNVVGPFTLVDPNPPATPTITVVANICSGKNLTLAASTSTGGTATYNWSGSNSFTAIGTTVNINNIPTKLGGVYNVTVTINGCTSSAGTATVAVDSTPQAPVIAGNTTICSDSTLKLTATTASGGTMTYNWTVPVGTHNNTATITISNITAANAGVYSVTATSAANCISANGTTNVTVNPTPIISNLTFKNPTACATATGSISFNVTTSGTHIVTYTKNGSSQNISLSPVAGVITIPALTAGVYDNITVSIASCPSNKLGPVTLLDPNPPATPTITAPANICSGKNLTITASTTSVGVPTYNWTFVNGATPQGATQTINNITVAQSGTYRVNVTINLCKSNDTTLVLTVDSTPVKPVIVSNSPICSDSAIKLSTSNIYPFTVVHNWSFGGSSINNTQSFSIPNAQVNNAGFYRVFVTSNAGCISIADSVNITINKSPSIAILDTLNPTECASAKGYINLNGLLPNTLYHIYYTNNSNIKTQDQTSNGSGILKVDTLRAGTYSNIYVTLNNCPSKTVGPITLVDPTPPVMPTITSFDSICSGKNLSLSANTISVGGVPIYTWTYPTGTIVNGQSIAINNIPKYFSGTYKVYVTINKCQSSEASKFIRVDSTPLAPSIIVNSPVCSDSTIQLQASTTSPGDMSYSWAGVNSFTSSLQNPTLPNAQQINAGNYSVFVTSAIGSCSSTITNQNVTINQSPNITIQDSTNPNQCATPSGFINLNGLNANTSYNIFYTINSSIKMQTQTSNGSGVLRLDTLRAGIYSNIYVTLNGCPSKPVKDVTLADPNPPATPIIIGVDSICSGQNLVLFAASPIANAIYTWTKPNASITNGTSVTINSISVAQSGLYKLYVTLNLCQSKDTSLFVRVDSTPVAPIIITNSPVCSDSTIVLQASTVSPGNMNYSWTGANSFISALQNPTIPNAQLINAGSYSVFATSQIGGCISATISQNVVVNASPNVAAMPDTTYKDGVPSGLIAFSGNVAGTTFNWTNSNPTIGLSASGTGDIVSFTTSNTTPFPIFGIITVTPSTNFCTGKPITFKITVNPTPRLTSPFADTICTDNLWQYQATSSTPNVTFTWVRNLIAGISNAASASADSSGLINETLTNTTSQPINVPYIFKLYSLGSVNIDTVKLTVNPDAKALYTYTNDKFCAPGNIDTANIKLQPYALANGSFEWYADGVLIGTGLQFPGYTILNNGDTVKIRLKAISLYGCKSDSFEHSFYNVKTPVVSFTKSIASGCGPLSVNFTNTTTPLAYPSYQWDFGNGNTSTLQSPVNIIFREDTSNRRVDTTYYIKLTAYTECDSISYVDSVTVFAQPKALFQPDTTVGCSIFKFRAFNNSWGQHNTYTWDFGDSTALVIDTAYGYYYHNFYTAVTDTFNVKLKAVNKCGSDSFEVKIVVFPNTIVPKLIVDGNSNYGCAPVQVRFVNNTVGANKFTIKFGDGSLPYISNKNPDTVYHTYQSGGNFIATLKAQNSCTDSTVALTLQLYDKPQAKFYLSSNQFCKKETIQFKNLSDSTLSFEWWFGDGGTSTNLHPTHRYLSVGNYTITLIAKSTNPTGAVCTDTIRKTITVHDLPVSSFTNNAAIQNCQPYYFVGITNLLPSEIANWTFSDSFSNDTTQAGNVGVHTFKQVGIYKVQLVIFNVYGCTDTSSTNVKVIETPKVAFAISDTLSCIPGKSVNCTNQTTYSSADAVNYQWYINGVLQATTKDLNYTFNVPVTITVAANFIVKLVAINSYGCRDSATKLFVIYPKAQPSFAINANVGCVPFNLQFNNTTKYANLFNWYLDGQLFSTSAVPNPIVLSNPATTYNIKLVANHTLGCGADSVTKQFTTYTKPVADFLIPNKNSCTGILNIQCFDLSSVVGASITKWNWIFGDGATDTIKNPKHTYTTAGHFNVGLVATDNRGCKSDIAYQRVANFGKPKANFSVGNVCVKNPLLPLNLSTPGLGSTAITNYLWNFGDGNYLTGSQPIYVYQNEGNYTLTLIVTSDSSCVADTMMKTVTVYGKPTADFKFENNCVKENTLFTNTSLTGFGQSLIGNSKWLFGDGGSSNNYNAAHIFNATGDYVVQLAVSGNRCPNLTDSIKKVVTVYIPRDPVIYPRIEGVRGTPIQFYALSGGVQYNWIPITGLDNAGIQNPIGNYNVSHPNIISYTISITDSLGCKVKDKQEVWLFADADIFVPTAFTPNGDGANDVLKPLYVNIAKVNYFRIFDRWGKVVFETSDMGKAWDGTLNGGNLPMETYSWMISAITQQGKELIRKGNTTLIRN